ncbi:MAG: SMC-Scp complex subunit ScpB [Chlamydiales bacterium]
MITPTLTTLEVSAQEEERLVLIKKGKQILEALLFASNEPLPLKRVEEVMNTYYPFSKQELLTFIDELNDEYLLQDRAFSIVEIGQGYLMRTLAEFHPYLDQLYRKKHPEKLSKASLEVLAIIAYKQPITRTQIEEIRGVDSSSIVQMLQDREFITEAGQLESPGRPMLYKTTTEFLSYFGLKDGSELKQHDTSLENV